MRRVVGYSVVVMAFIAAFLGLVGTKWYVWDVVIAEADASDRSMLFWGLPILLLALGAIVVAVGLGFFARRLLRVG